MRREGRHHGMALSFGPGGGGGLRSPRRGLLLSGAASSPPARPSDRSKISGRPAGVRQPHPTKSKDKCKGARKARGLDIGLNPRLVSWRVIGPGGASAGWRLAAGDSASAAAVYLSGYPHEDEEEEEEEETLTMEEQRERYAAAESKQPEELDVGGAAAAGGGGGEEDEEDVGEEEEEEGDDDVMGFFEVWGTWEYVDEEDWCVVGDDMEEL
ncbi:unnamed protein product [Spirodela intermedia]|uniref:Uncharacterized protein n=2 Tax=Spirodela intermedia TaxID=51605 RepID=A0A7I8L5Y8_SPIIN|nr:unnamed protein product [Spirodela intermedia]CAA6668263.1 unnamed protein product [Spirodela intermedia]CAA7405096.1 unnamed protein product [Spirodela intermedia]